MGNFHWKSAPPTHTHTHTQGQVRYFKLIEMCPPNSTHQTLWDASSILQGMATVWEYNFGLLPPPPRMAITNWRLTYRAEIPKIITKMHKCICFFILLSKGTTLELFASWFGLVFWKLLIPQAWSTFNRETCESRNPNWDPQAMVLPMMATSASDRTQIWQAKKHIFFWAGHLVKIFANVKGEIMVNKSKQTYIYICIYIYKFAKHVYYIL